MWIHPINKEILGRNRLKTRNQIGIPCDSVIMGIGMNWLPARVYLRHPTAATGDRCPIGVPLPSSRAKWTDDTQSGKPLLIVGYEDALVGLGDRGKHHIQRATEKEKRRHLGLESCAGAREGMSL
jgi:hypothetical protein